MPVTPGEFRSGMRALAAPVNVITTAIAGERGGLTATAVMSLTAEPPQLGVAVNKANGSLKLIEKAGIFAVNVLTPEQLDIGNVFAGATEARGEARFKVGTWTAMATGAPILRQAKANFDCRVVASFEFSTHVLFVGMIEAVRVNSAGDPLLYADGCYGEFVRKESRESAIQQLALQALEPGTAVLFDSPW